MPYFTPITPRCIRYSSAYLDDCAMRAEPVARCGGGYSTTSETPDDQHGWSFLWVDRGGVGNHGRLVLIPTDRRTRAIARDGRIRWIMRELDVDASSAAALDRAARGVSYSREVDVIEWALWLTHMRPDTLETFPGVGRGARAWAGRHMPMWMRMSMPRLDSAVTIAQRCLGLAD